MAEVRIEAAQVVLHLSAGEKVEGVHGDLRVPFSSVRRVEALEDAMAEVHGLRAPGTGIPGLVAVGTYLDRGTRIFAAVHHNTHRGVRVVLDGGGYDQWIVGCADPEAVVASMSSSPN